MSFLEPRVNVLQTLHHSSVSWDINLLYFFIQNFIWYGQNEHIKVQNFRLATARMKINQIPCVNFEATSHFFLTLHHSLGSWDISFDITFVLFHLKLYMICTKRTHQSANFWTCELLSIRFFWQSYSNLKSTLNLLIGYCKSNSFFSWMTRTKFWLPTDNIYFFNCPRITFFLY